MFCMSVWARQASKGSHMLSHAEHADPAVKAALKGMPFVENQLKSTQSGEVGSFCCVMTTGSSCRTA